MNEDGIFDRWNIYKKRLQASFPRTTSFPAEREIWVVTFGKNIGIEQNGGLNDFSRPALVIKKFNNQMYWVVPLSTKQKKLDFYYNFIDSDNNKVSIILGQLRFVSAKRFRRKMYTISTNLFRSVQGSLREMLL
jgi:mRNA interferase MazF